MYAQEKKEPRYGVRGGRFGRFFKNTQEERKQKTPQLISNFPGPGFPGPFSFNNLHFQI